MSEPKISDEVVRAFNRAYNAYPARFDLTHVEEANERVRYALTAVRPQMCRQSADADAEGGTE